MQTSGDTGKGGICTHSILMGVQAMSDKGADIYSVAELFTTCIRIDDKVFNSPQDISLNTSPNIIAVDWEWPLIPKSAYTSPYNKAPPAIQHDLPTSISKTYMLLMCLDYKADADRIPPLTGTGLFDCQR